MKPVKTDVVHVGRFVIITKTYADGSQFVIGKEK